MVPREPRLSAVTAEQPYPLLFVTLSGAHLYGFASPDSDYDLRGVHVLPLPDVLGLHAPRETIEVAQKRDGLDIDLVTHDARKFFALLLKRNGYVLEQLLSPLILHTTSEHAELRDLARGCVTRHHAHHYLAFAANQWKRFSTEPPPRIKPLLYVYRVLLTGVHLMRTGEVEANLPRLNETFRLNHVADLIARKTATREQAALDAAELPFHEAEYRRLLRALEQAAAETTLPAAPTARDALSDLLVRLRLHGVSRS